MAKVNKIVKKDGTATPYFWSNEDGADPARRTVFKRTEDGVKRMKGVHFDAVRNKLVKE